MSKLDRYIPWIWGINGVTSVLGSVTAIVVAMKFGLVQALLVGAVCYLFASLLISIKGKRAVE